MLGSISLDFLKSYGIHLFSINYNSSLKVMIETIHSYGMCNVFVISIPDKGLHEETYSQEKHGHATANGGDVGKRFKI